MLWRVTLAPSTLKDLKAIEEYHEQIDADYAQAIIKRLFDRFDSLTRLPHRGSRPRIEELKQYLQVFEKPYRILYRVDDAERLVNVVAVIHQSQDTISTWRTSPR